VAAGRPAGAFDPVALPQREPADLADGDVDVLGSGQVAAGAEEPVALVPQVEVTGDRNGLALELLLLSLPRQIPLAPLSPVASVASATAPIAAVAGLGVAIEALAL